MSRPRLTLRRLMAFVAMMGLVFAYGDRYRRYRRLADYHLAEVERSLPSRTPGGGYFSSSGAWIVEGHLQKSMDYDRAAPFPWIWVDPEVRPVDAARFDRGFDRISP